MSTEPCPQCGSTTIYIDDDDGNQYCGNGHRQDTGLQIENEQEFGQRGKTLKRKEIRGRTKVSRIYRGKKGYELYLQAWQFLLWKMCYALVNVCGVKEEVWGVVRGLWAVRLGRLVGKFEEGFGADEGVSGASEGVEGTTETDTNTEGETEDVRFKSVRKPGEGPRLLDVAALSYLGLMVIRYPLPLAEFFEWMQNETLPFMRAIRHVPGDIKDHLASEYHRVLDTTYLLKPADLQQAVYRMGVMYSTTLGITIPPINHLLLLQQYIEALALPLPVYAAAKRLDKITEFTFSYPTSPKMRRNALSYPEAQLMSLVVLATKLTFPFDSPAVRRYPYSLNDPAALKFDWHTWLEAKSKFDDEVKAMQVSKLEPGKQMEISDLAVLQMDDGQLDEYMDWYQGMWLNTQRKEEGIQKEILDMFPPQDRHEPTTDEQGTIFRNREAAVRSLRDERLKRVVGSLKPRQVVNEQAALAHEAETGNRIMRPGEGYQQFRKLDELSGAARVFYEEAAKTSCLSLDMLVRAVRAAEERVDKWRKEMRREKVFAKEGGVESDRVMEDAIVAEDEEMYV